MISSSMLGGIAVTKAITPDMDAAVIGGVVDFALRKAAMDPQGTDGDQSWLPRIELRAQGGYTKLKTSYDNYKFVGSIEKRFVDQSFGVFILGSAEKRNLSSNVLAQNTPWSTRTTATQLSPSSAWPSPTCSGSVSGWAARWFWTISMRTAR